MKASFSRIFDCLRRVLKYLVGIGVAYGVERYFDIVDYNQLLKNAKLLGVEISMEFETIWMWTISIFANLSFPVFVGISLVLIFGKVEKFFRDKRRHQQEQRKSLLNDIEKAYSLLRMVCEPKTMNPQNPGNPDFMKSEARDFVNPMIPRL